MDICVELTEATKVVEAAHCQPKLHLTHLSQVKNNSDLLGCTEAILKFKPQIEDAKKMGLLEAFCSALLEKVSEKQLAVHEQINEAPSSRFYGRFFSFSD